MTSESFDWLDSSGESDDPGFGSVDSRFAFDGRDFVTGDPDSAADGRDCGSGDPDFAPGVRGFGPDEPDFVFGDPGCGSDVLSRCSVPDDGDPDLPSGYPDSDVPGWPRCGSGDPDSVGDYSARGPVCWHSEDDDSDPAAVARGFAFG